jgi:hypothetical protein
MQHVSSALQHPHTCSGEEVQPGVLAAQFLNTADVQTPQSMHAHAATMTHHELAFLEVNM